MSDYTLVNEWVVLSADNVRWEPHPSLAAATHRAQQLEQMFPRRGPFRVVQSAYVEVSTDG